MFTYKNKTKDQLVNDLQDSERRYRLLAENVTDVIWTTDMNLRLTYISPSVTRMRGYSVKEAMAQSLEEALTPASFEVAKKAFSEEVALEKIKQKELLQPRVMELEFNCKDGSTVWVETKGALLRDSDGRVIGVAGVDRSIAKRKQMEEELKRYRDYFEELIEERTIKLNQSLKKTKRVLKETIRAMALTVEAKDPYIGGHQQRVANLARAIAREMDLKEEQVNGIYMAGTIHDLGKISVPGEILNRPGLLNELEFKMITFHVQISYDILKEIEFPWPVAQIILQHHERMDGSGYPQGFKGEEIIQEARIIAVADVVEAMASPRPYRAALGIDKALDEILKNKGVLYDPEVVDTCLILFLEKGYQFEKSFQVLGNVKENMKEYEKCQAA